jgi:hypothetical protein
MVDLTSMTGVDVTMRGTDLKSADGFNPKADTLLDEWGKEGAQAVTLPVSGHSMGGVSVSSCAVKDGSA